MIQPPAKSRSATSGSPIAVRDAGRRSLASLAARLGSTPPPSKVGPSAAAAVLGVSVAQGLGASPTCGCTPGSLGSGRRTDLRTLIADFARGSTGRALLATREAGPQSTATGSRGASAAGTVKNTARVYGGQLTWERTTLRSDRTEELSKLAEVAYAAYGAEIIARVRAGDGDFIDVALDMFLESSNNPTGPRDGRNNERVVGDIRRHFFPSHRESPVAEAIGNQPIASSLNALSGGVRSVRGLGSLTGTPVASSIGSSRAKSRSMGGTGTSLSAVLSRISSAGPLSARSISPTRAVTSAPGRAAVAAIPTSVTISPGGFPGGGLGGAVRTPTKGNFAADSGCSADRMEKLADLNGLLNDVDNLLRLDHCTDVTGRWYTLAVAALTGPVFGYNVLCVDDDCKNFASYQPWNPGSILVTEKFWETTMGVAPQEVRASVILHELIHLLNEEFYDAEPVFPDSTEIPHWQDEFSAALVQMDFLNLPTCMQDILAAAYADLNAGGNTLTIAWDALTGILESCLGFSETVADITAAAIIVLVLAGATLAVLASTLAEVVSFLIFLLILGVTSDCF